MKYFLALVAVIAILMTAAVGLAIFVSDGTIAINQTGQILYPIALGVSACLAAIGLIEIWKKFD